MPWRQLIHRGLHGGVVQEERVPHAVRAGRTPLVSRSLLAYLALHHLIRHRLPRVALYPLDGPASSLTLHGDHDALADGKVVDRQVRWHVDVRRSLKHQEPVTELDERAGDGRAYGLLRDRGQG